MPFNRFHITPRSAFGTPLKSDTLMGHLLCAAGMLEGEKHLTALVDGFANDRPEFVVSSAFPKGMLPMPVLEPVPRSVFQQVAETHAAFGGSMHKALSAYKMFKKIKYLPIEVFIMYQASLDMLKLFRHWLDAPETFVAKTGTCHFQPHNSIDRRNGTALSEGGFYFSEATYNQPGAELEIYIKTDDLECVERYLRYVSDTGYGADRSTGKGYLEFRRDDEFDPMPFEAKQNGSMLLSICSNNDLNGFVGTYGTTTKYGKVWNGFGEMNPYKKPFLAFTEGSIFTSMPKTGYILNNVHANPKIVQMTLPLTIPIGVEVSR